MLAGGLGGQQQAEYVDVELAMELFFGDALERGKCVDAGVVDQDVQLAEVLDRRVDDALCIGFLETSPLTATALPPALLISATTFSAPVLLEA
jgi:hypothetical protein